jgi:hypothetical protein
MKQIECAKAVALAALTAGGLVGTANAAVLDSTTHAEVALSSAAGDASLLAYLEPSLHPSLNGKGETHTNSIPTPISFEGEFEF